MTTNEIAKICHEANKAYCEAIGDTSQVSWDKAPDWQKSSSITGVHFAIENPDAGDDALHNSWMKQKVSEGWVYGEKKDPEKRTHHCLVPFEQLPKEQQVKDKLFFAIVNALK